MKQKTIYLAGKVKGLPFDQAAALFTKRQTELEALGYKVINPIVEMKIENALRQKVGQPVLSDACPKDRREILKLCLKWMLEADEIDLLFNWRESEFAQKERDVAVLVGMPVHYPPIIDLTTEKR